MPGGVEREVRVAQQLGVRAAGASQQRAHAREQLFERERLDEVVVRARVETRDAVPDAVAGGQHEHGRRVSRSTEVAADLDTVDPRHEDVEHDGVRVAVVGAEALDRLGPVGSQLHLVALELERAPQRLAHCAFVVHHQDLHGRNCAALR